MILKHRSLFLHPYAKCQEKITIWKPLQAGTSKNPHSKSVDLHLYLISAATLMKILATLLFLLVSSQSFSGEVDNLREERSYYDRQLEKTKYRMLDYVLEHKLATAAVLAAGGGLGAFLQKNMDEDTRNIIIFVGIFGLGYCFDNTENAKECARVTAELGSYAARIGGYETKISTIDSNLLSLQSPAKTAIPGPTEISSGWTMCNSSDEATVSVAYAYKDDQGWVREGWRNIPRGECSILKPELNTRYVYYYAEGQNGKWAGDKDLCAHPTEKFTFRDGSICSGEFTIYPYKEVDTGESQSWTTNLVE